MPLAEWAALADRVWLHTVVLRRRHFRIHLGLEAEVQLLELVVA